MFDVLHSIADLSNASGGPTNFLSQLLNEFYQSGQCNNKIFTSYSKDISNEFLVHPICSKAYLKKIYYINNLFKNYKIINPAIIHHHGLWQYPIIASYNFSKKKNLPFIISPHGMLEPWSLNQKSFLKNIASQIYQNKIIRSAKYIHATSLMEATNIRNLGFENRITVIPNGINTTFYNINKPHNYIYNSKNILFLSRIHKKKGIELLIESYSYLENDLRKNYTVQIVGTGEKNYIAYLNKLIKSKGLEQHIKILKPVYGYEKVKLLQDAYIFILPSYSENFGNVIAESLSCGTPVITTLNTPWEILNKTNSGWCIDFGIEPLFNCLNYVLKLDNISLNEISQNSRNLAQNNLDISITAKMHFDMYFNIINSYNSKKLSYEF